MKWNVIKCVDIYDKGTVIKTYHGLFSWFKAMWLSIELCNKNDGFIYGIEK